MSYSLSELCPVELMFIYKVEGLVLKPVSMAKTNKEMATIVPYTVWQYNSSVSSVILGCV